MIHKGWGFQGLEANTPMSRYGSSLRCVHCGDMNLVITQDEKGIHVECNDCERDLASLEFKPIPVITTVIAIK